jgi:ubiquinone/menaquinone biosynthesis C-methylase UbiE
VTDEQETTMTTATYRSYSDSAAELYESFFVPAIATPVSAELLRVADLRPGERVLDLACGTGVITRAAAERVGPTGSVTGLDLAPDMLTVATRTPAGGAPITWHQGDAASLPLPDRSYDVVLCQMGLMFMEDRAAALTEAHRVLAPSGRIVVNTPGRVQPLFVAMEAAIAAHIDPDLAAFLGIVFSLHDPDDLAAQLSAAGFDDVSGTEYVATLDLPAPAEFLWSYINLTPLGAIVAEAPAEAKHALERTVVEAWAPSVVDGRIAHDQPMVLASGRRT